MASKNYMKPEIFLKVCIPLDKAMTPVVAELKEDFNKKVFNINYIFRLKLWKI